eukprot:comp17537_c0_seq1/m.17095 comp17537_c0_seq1/g.17095  ORF comp17537_c0_seq1/g.17095 comp17537_c0_seq1/m.17095 type:complete len:403 (+) comp17537_c0_seq1:258-1466(+)
MYMYVCTLHQARLDLDYITFTYFDFLPAQPCMAGGTTLPCQRQTYVTVAAWPHLQLVLCGLLLILILDLLLFFLIVIVILLVILLLLVLLRRLLGLLCFPLLLGLLVGLLLQLLLPLDRHLERLLRELLGLRDAVGNEDVVEDRPGLDLPQVETDGAEVLVQVEVVVGLVLGVGDLGLDPLALVGRVVDLLGGPGALVLGVGDLGGLPLTIILIIPVLGLLGIGVVDLLGRQEVPVLLELAAGGLLKVNQDLVGVVGLDNKGVQVGRLVVLSRDIDLLEQVLALVGEDDVHTLGAAANIGAEHDRIRGVTVHLLLVEVLSEDLNVTTTAVNALLVLDGELDYEVLTLVAEGVELSGNSVELGILASLETLILLSVGIELASRQLPLALLGALERGRDPAALV